jgi:hypothetical protein
MIKSNSFAFNKKTPTLVVRSLLMCALVTLSTGCATLENEEGRLPDAMRTAVRTFSASGYPDLTKLPETPKNIPSAATWSALEAGLVAQGQEVASNPSAAALTPADSDLTWAQTARTSLEIEPLAQPVAPVQSGASAEQDAAAAARAKFDADFARLPPL